MSHIQFGERDANHLVAGGYSTGRGQVLRSDRIEVTKIRFQEGFGADTFHGSDVSHSAEAIEDTVAISFKNLVNPNYEATGRLGGQPSGSRQDACSAGRIDRWASRTSKAARSWAVAAAVHATR